VAGNDNAHRKNDLNETTSEATEYSPLELMYWKAKSDVFARLLPNRPDLTAKQLSTEVRASRAHTDEATSKRKGEQAKEMVA
jgi:hypothetical protein